MPFVPDKPSTGRFVPDKPKEEESPTSVGNLLGAAVEPNLSLATGAVAAPVSGLAGLAGAALPGPPGQGAEWTRRVGKALTYEPKTQGGQTALGAISYPFRKIGEGAEAAGGKVSDITGSPAAGAGVNTLLQMLPQLLGAKGLGRAAEATPRVIPKMTPEPSPAVQSLAQRGVQMTPGQLLGGGWDRAEQALSKWPIVGAPIRGARARAFDDFNHASMNDVLAPIGEKVPEGMVGQKGVAYINDKLGDRYDSILEKTTGRLDPKPAPPNALQAPAGTSLAAPGQIAQPPFARSLRFDLTNLKNMVDNSTLPDKLKLEFGRVINEDIIAKFTEKGGLASGETIKTIDTNLRVLAQKKALDSNRDVNTQGLAIGQARAALKDMISRENPGLAADLKATDAAYAKFKIVQKASVAAGKEGVFTPAQLERAVRTKDPTKDKRAFSEGTANMQDLAKEAREALGDAIPDSGTPFQQLLVALLIPGKKGLGILGAPGGLTAMSGLSLPYSKPGTKLIQKALTGPPTVGPAAARALPFGAAEAGQQMPPPMQQ